MSPRPGRHGYLLYGGADVAEADVDARLAYTRVGRVPHRLGQRVVPRVEVVREGAVDDAPCPCPLLETRH